MEHLEPVAIDENLEVMKPVLDVNVGNDNFLELPELGIAFEGISNKIVVLLDQYSSGYECPKCKGMKKMRRIIRCKCDPDISDEKLAEDFGTQRGYRNRHMAFCEDCAGDYMSKRKEEIIDCPVCQGKGGSLIIPDSAKSLPTTGVVIATGPDVTKVKRHTRIIATPYSGTFLPMKGNARIKIYTENEPLCYLHNMRKDGSINEQMVNVATNQIEPLDTTNFVEVDVPLGEENNI